MFKTQPKPNVRIISEFSWVEVDIKHFSHPQISDVPKDI